MTCLWWQQDSPPKQEHINRHDVFTKQNFLFSGATPKYWCKIVKASSLPLLEHLVACGYQFLSWALKTPELLWQIKYKWQQFHRITYSKFKSSFIPLITWYAIEVSYKPEYNQDNKTTSCHLDTFSHCTETSEFVQKCHGVSALINQGKRVDWVAFFHAWSQLLTGISIASWNCLFS